MVIFMVETYCYNTFSYSGVEIAEQEYFSTKEKAKIFIESHGLVVLENKDLAFSTSQNANIIATIEEITVK